VCNGEFEYTLYVTLVEQCKDLSLTYDLQPTQTVVVSSDEQFKPIKYTKLRIYKNIVKLNILENYSENGWSHALQSVSVTLLKVYAEKMFKINTSYSEKGKTSHQNSTPINDD
jgi:hypothetical protein